MRRANCAGGRRIGLARILIACFAAGLGYSHLALAQAAGAGPVASQCASEIKAYCADKEHGAGEVRAGTETRTGTSGIYMSMNPATIAPFTAMSQLASVPGFSYWQVPNALPGTKFDQFPGSPSPTGQDIAFKGNWTNASGVGQTGVYYREVTSDGGKAPVRVIADTGTLIPGQPAGEDVRIDSAAERGCRQGGVRRTRQ